jgi:hypothetical protein
LLGFVENIVQHGDAGNNAQGKADLLGNARLLGLAQPVRFWSTSTTSFCCNW